MSSPGQPKGVGYTPDHHRSGTAVSITSSVGSIPLRHPPTVHSGQSTHNCSTQQWHTYDYLKREHGSLSGASTEPSRQNTPRPRPGPTNIHSLNPFVTFGTEESSLETPRPEAYPTRYTRTSRSEMAEVNTAYHKSYEDDDSSGASDDHAIWVLLWLSLIDPLYCTLAALYTLLILIPLLLLTPLQLCKSTFDFSSSIVRFVSPIFRQHLIMLCTESAEHLHDLEYKTMSLVAVYLAAPILSVAITIAAWISASFWIFAIIIGNPDGTERGDDGRATVLGVRNWWEKYLLSAAR